MVDLNALAPSEMARLLGRPDGEAGRAVGKMLNRVNANITAAVYRRLQLRSGNHVLEIGFGNGRLLPAFLVNAPDLTYVGVDIAETMVTEASAFNAEQVAAGRASFRLASARPKLRSGVRSQCDLFLDGARAGAGRDASRSACRRLQRRRHRRFWPGRGTAALRAAGVRSIAAIAKPWWRCIAKAASDASKFMITRKRRRAPMDPLETPLRHHRGPALRAHIAVIRA